MPQLTRDFKFTIAALCLGGAFIAAPSLNLYPNTHSFSQKSEPPEEVAAQETNTPPRK